MGAKIEHTWPDGSRTELEVGTDSPAYPDAASECVARVLDLWRGTCKAQGDDD